MYTDSIGTMFQAGSAELDWDDRLALALQSLYRSCGYRRYRFNSFESYDVYRENKGFLGEQSIVTFTDPKGRLLALKPDVTMSIVKNLSPDRDSEKLFYRENVFRVNPRNGEFGEIAQIGLENIGCASGDVATAVEAEVLSLAIQSLALIGDEYALSLSHMGFVTSLLAFYGVSDASRDQIFHAFNMKSVDQLEAALASCSLSDEQANALRRMLLTCDPLAKALEWLCDIDMNDSARQCLDSIASVAALIDEDRQSHILLDFSLIGELDYYNGIYFRGFIKGLPRAVLSGGRYDKLLERFDKPQGAVGFAIYLGEFIREYFGR